MRVPLATKLILSYLAVIAITVVVAGIVGTRLVGNMVVAEAQTAVTNDLNAAREILQGRLSDINDIVRLTADRFFLKDALLAGNIGQAASELTRVRKVEALDFLTVTDSSGDVLLRTSNPNVFGDYRNHDDLIAAARRGKNPVAAVSIITAEDLRKESPNLADLAYFRFIDTPKARVRAETEETSGMVLEAAAPIEDAQKRVIGFLYGGILLNRNFEIVDKVKHTVFRGVQYQGKDIGTATIFQDDVRIATNVMNPDGSRAIGTRAAADVYDQVVVEGKPWIGRAFVVNNWYITAYEPIRNVGGKITGILYVGVLEQKYVDIRKRTVGVFLAITLVGGLIAAVLSSLISRRVSATVTRLTRASQDMAHGNLDVKVAIKTNDELENLADAFNAMAASLKRRDEQLKEYATTKIRESERLALTGQLAAGVAHELNNPLQGILAYSHLLLERTPPESPSRPSLQKIANQADRCREIIRGLLDFARPRTPHLRPFSLNAILRECMALVENQAMFHNIRIVSHLADDLPPATVDPAQLQEVFMNLIINAAEAMDGVGDLTLSTRFDPGRRVVEADVADTGHGIRPEDMDRIFDPFFTTKAPGHGVGLGLAISQRILREHRGTIGVHSEVGKGTTFTVAVPIASQEEAQA